MTLLRVDGTMHAAVIAAVEQGGRDHLLRAEGRSTALAESSL